MRRFLITTGMLVTSVGWLTAQEAARTSKSSDAGQSSQTDAQKKTAGERQNPAAADENSSSTDQKSTASKRSANTREQEQNPNQNVTNQVRPGSGAGHAAQSMHLNNYFIACLRADNHGEVEISKLATQRAANPEVKTFAQQMVKDHSAFLAKLDGLNPSGAGQPGSGADSAEKSRETSAAVPPTSGRRDSAKSGEATSGGRSQNPNRSSVNPADVEAGKDRAENSQSAKRGDATGDSDDSSNREESQNRTSGAEDIATDSETRTVSQRTGSSHSATHGTGYGQLIQVKQEIAERCLASAQRELGDKQGAEFDKCYIGLQVVKHMEMVDALSVLSRHASGELQQVLNEGLQSAQQHLDHVKQIAKKIEGSSDGQVSRDASTDSGRKANEKANEDKNN